VRILHLAYEDALQPGSGGGSIRAREINRRLGGRHEITALVAGYPGAKPRLEDGVRWVPIGTRTGAKIDRLAYFALLGPEVARRPHDLVVEEFGAPFSTGLSPLFTKKPVVASVQWLFASQMREKYRLPFDSFERRGLRLYDRFIAVSDWLAGDLQARRPEAVVESIPNGVEEIAFETETSIPKHLLFVGRLDIAHKGGDLLFDILDRVAKMRGGSVPPLVIAGDGPDRGAMEKLARRSGLSHLVEFRGRVEGPDKYQLMADAHAVMMPSRHETFGMVAVESLAAGGAPVAFDVGPIREVAGGEPGGETGARLVRPYNLDAFAREVVRLIDDPGLTVRLREASRRWARRYDWDRIATRQEEFYLRAVGDVLPNSGVPNTTNQRSGRGGVGVTLAPSHAKQSRLPRRRETGDEEGSTR
jgi:glycosyltransferase involved in cell wall biosynthesis